MPDEILNPELETDVIDQGGNNDLDGEAELLAALKALNAEPDEDEEEEVDEDPEDETEDDEEESDEEDLEDEEEETEEEEEVEEPKKTEKKKQSPEENAKFAAKRRQEELDRKVQERLDQLKQESPEFKLAQQLSELYGVPADKLVEQIQEAQLQKKAQETGISIESLRAEQQKDQRMEAMEQELNRIKFEGWQNKIKADSQTLQSKYSMLTDEDMDAAVDYILNTARNVDLPLEQAVYAVHGQKIIESLANGKVQDKLAQESGRKKKTPLAPNKGKAASPTKSLTAEEKQIAKAFNMSEADYLKYKS